MNRIFYVIGVVVVAVRHAVLHFEVRRGEFVPLIKLSPVYRDSLFQRGVQKKRSSPEGSEIQRKPLEMRWRRSVTRRPPVLLSSLYFS